MSFPYFYIILNIFINSLTLLFAANSYDTLFILGANYFFSASCGNSLQITANLLINRELKSAKRVFSCSVVEIVKLEKLSKFPYLPKPSK